MNHFLTPPDRCKAPSSRRWARLLATAPEKVDTDERRFIEHLGQIACSLIQGVPLTNAFTTMMLDHHDTGFDVWFEAARASELRSLATALIATMLRSERGSQSHGAPARSRGISIA